ncbi:hypothetical protein Q8791_23610 [Nocardiopsis sp. CT-R113]|uniref:MerR family transcriptional regulator n=1 Tax=Nocardiopsis codii TaxID=3065942 RepID=A0ABU7KDU8_9ACTN|nr:hypothetical protein [Nocardiopsis sp. CT-R113]MEE2040207.1 hypothetical protein [Nocardiopsis sp. CT-R113]
MNPLPLIHGDKVDTADAARILGKTTSAIYVYTSRGVKLASGERFYLRPAGHDHRGRHLYALADLRTIAQAVRERGRSHKPVLAAA